MKNVFKKFWISVIAILAMLCSLVGCKLTNDNATISFKDTMVSYVTVNTTLNVAEYLEYTEGYDVELKAEYAGGSYKTYGLSFMPTELGEVTLTASLKGTKATATAKVEVKIAPPKVISDNECIRYRGEEFELSSLKEALNVVAKDDVYTFKAISAKLIGGEEVISFTGLTSYTFANVGNYEIVYELSNDGGTTEGAFLLWVKRVLTDNEVNDISNYGQGVFSKDSATVTVDETEKAAGSDWCFVVKADPAATGESDTNYTQNYWTNYAHLQIEDGISLSEKYLELDIQFSPDSRNLMIFQFIDAGFTSSSVDYIVRANGTDWQHVSFKDVYKYGNYEYLRIIVLHPQTSKPDSYMNAQKSEEGYNAANVWVKIDNVTLHEYDVPYEYHEPISYTYTDADYTASEGFEEGKVLWEDLANSKNYTSLIQAGEYTNEETEFNFTLENAGVGKYEFAVGVRANDSMTKGIFVEFKRDAGNAFFNVWGNKIAGEWIEAKTQFFTDGHNYTIRLAMDGTTLKMTIIDNTTQQTLTKYEKDLSGYTVEENGCFVFTTRKTVTVACMKPHAILVEEEVKETTIGNITIGDTNQSGYIHLNIGKGQFPSGIVSASNNLAYADGTFATGATWTTATDTLKFKGNVGVLADTATTLQVFPTGTAAGIGDKLNIPQGATIIVGEYTATFEEELSLWFNGTQWVTEYVEPQEPEKPEDTQIISGVMQGEWCASTSSATQLRLNATSNNVPTTIVNWNKQLGIAGVSSMYGSGDVTWFAMDISPAATVGTAITIPTTEFVVDEVTYKFDQEYTFYFDGTAWGTEFVAAPELPPVDNTLMTLGEVKSNSNANTIFVRSTNVPVLVKNWIWDLPESVAFRASITLTGTTATITGGLSIYSESEGTLVITGLNAVAGTYIKLDGGVTVTVDGNERKFDKAYEFWFNGETWQTEEYVVPSEPEDTTVVISGVVQGEWCASTSSATQIRLNATSNNVPTTVVNWNSQLGIAGVNSMYGGAADWFAMDLSPAATVGTAITIPTTEFVVDEVTYKFDQEYTFYFDGTAWGTEFVAVPEEPEVPTVTVISELTVRPSQNQTASLAYINVGSLNIPTKTMNWNEQLGIAGITSMYPGTAEWFAFELSTPATVGTVVVLPADKEFAVEGKAYKFDKEYSIYFDGSVWTMEFVAVPEEPEVPAVTVISGVVQGEWCASTSSANQLRLNATSNNVPTTIVNWNKQLGIAGVSSMYGAGDVTWFAMDISPAATVGTAITIPTTEFVVDEVTYKFDQEYTFYFDGTSWGTEYVAAPQEPEQPTVTVLSDLTVRPSTKQTASLAYINVGSLNIPTKTMNWNKELGIAGITSMYPGTAEWFAFELSTPATVGTVVVLPADKEFTVEDKAYKFDKEYSIYFDGSVWTMDFVAVPEEPDVPEVPEVPSAVVISQVLIGEWCASTSKANQIRVNAASLNIPTTVVNWIWTGEGGAKSEFGKEMISSASSIYGQAADWFVIELHAAATEGTQIVLVGNKTFTVDGVDYMFDRDYTFTYTNGAWTVA